VIQKHLVIVGALLLLPGCWNVDNAKNIRFGGVSIGQQMIDLKRALEESAITPDEHTELKQALMSLNSLCEGQDTQEES